MVNIRTDQLRRRMRLREAKTGKKRTVTISAALLAALAAQAGSEWVFEGRTDKRKHRTRQAVYKDLKRAAAALRLQHVSPHSVRKHYAVEIMNRYGFDEVRKALMHDSAEVTLLYALADKLKQTKPLRHRAHK